MNTKAIERIVSECSNRNELVQQFIRAYKGYQIAEVGVYKGELSKYLLSKIPEITNYLLVDPWRNLSDWKKPYNQSDESFEQIFQEVRQKLDFAKDKIDIQRGKTQEISPQIENSSLDFIYLDGDHTLKGITIDLIQWWDKLKENGVLMGDDFYPSIKRNNFKYEPTLVFPLALYFAESKNKKIYGLPFNQFLIDKSQNGFEFIDLTSQYIKTELKPLISEIIEEQQASKSLKNRIKRLIKGR